MADLLYAELIKKIGKYHPATRLTLIEDAYNFALEAHGTQRRNSGEPYIVHPLSVATILAELELDLESIAAGILHDVVEDTSMTGADIERRFSHEIAMLVEGVTKLEKMKYTSKVEEQAENYRKMFLAMAKDIRVILIKIADRLHNMRTLSFMLPDKRREIAQETIDIYAPLAHRLGISKLRYELEDLSFKNLDPKAYFDLAGQISEKQTERKAYVDQIVGEINEKMASSNMAASVEGRPKHFFSIYKKMIAKNKTLDQIYDLFAVRVMVGEVRECYEVMGLLHETYLPIPGRVKDYIAMPKSNKYQSLHTTLISHGGEPFEVQIRTQEMHRVSEYGIAAHWKYKENEGSAGETDSEEEKLNWLRQMLDWQRELSDNGEFLDALRTDLSVFKNNVYCFTPKGDVINLTSGSTPIDFAYAIHSEVGNKMVGARVNGKIVTFDYALATGDRIEIITSQSSKGPGLDWLKLVKTNQARTKINQWFKNENRLENIQKGRELLEAEARKKNVSLQELLESGREASVLERFNFVDLDSLCAAVGYGGVRETQIVSRLYVEYEKTLPTATDAEILQELIDESDTAAANRKKKSGIVIEGLGDANVRFSRCCSPIPGDAVLGFVTRGRGVSIHRTDCPNIINIGEGDMERIIDANWQLPSRVEDNVSYRADLRMICDARDGLIMDVSRVLTDEKIKVKTLNARILRADAIINIGVEIPGRFQLERLCAKLTNLTGAHEIKRVTT